MNGYKTLSKKALPEINGTLHELIHTKTGARVLYLENEDTENLFSILFRTTPDSSNGIAHILEHCVLCGSKNFPVKDPFFAMTRRSLATFMNAMTGQDFTCYPASSELERDFYNLFEVYLDSVFRPNLDPLSFKQEGWRIEPENIDDPDSPLVYKGIVFNEMKGALSVPTARLVEEINRALYPTLTYGVNSGGDPKEIPNLTYEEFKRFFESFYHPSRAIFFFYGNLPLEKHLSFLEEKLLSKTEKLPPLKEIPLEKRLKAPKKVESFYPADSSDSPTFGAIAWLTTTILEQKEALALEILELILLDTDASPLKRALLDANISSSVSSYIDGDVSEIPFVLILQGLKEENSLEEILLSALKKIVKEGIPKKLIESALHQLEIDRCEITGGSYPYGLALFFRSALLALHGGAPERGLLFHSLFEEIREELQKNPRYFEDLTTKYLIDNPHRIFALLKPSETLAKEENDAECKKLAALKEKLSHEERVKLAEEAKKLEAFQQDLSELSCDILPKIALTEIPLSGKDYLLQEKGALIHTGFTSDFVYADLFAPLPFLKQEEISLARIYLQLLPEIGSGGKGFSETLEEIQESTGGLSATLSIFSSTEKREMQPMLHLSSKALSRHQEKMFTLLQRAIESPNFKDRARLRELIEKQITAVEANKVNHAMRYALTMASAPFSDEQHLMQLYSGWNHLLFMRKLAKDLDATLPLLIEQFERLQTLFFTGKRELVISCEEKNEKMMRGHEALLSSSELLKPFSFESPLSIQSQSIEIPAQVAFTAKAGAAPLFIDPAAAHLTLAANIAEKIHLHPVIREQGGAYGARATVDPTAGYFALYSYRDPSIQRTLQAFNDAAEAVAGGRFDDEDLEDAIRETIQSLDSPLSPSEKGRVAYTYLKEGRGLVKREKFRSQILNATKEAVREAAKEHLLKPLKSGVAITFAGKELIEEEMAHGSC